MRIVLEIRCDEPITKNWLACNDAMLALGGWSLHSGATHTELIARQERADIDQRNERELLHCMHSRADDLRRLKFNVVEETMRFLP